MTRMTLPLRRLMHDLSGASAAEFVLVLPLFLLFIAATIDFGGMVYKKLQIGSAANAGASYALTRGYNAAGIAMAIAGGTSLTGTTTSAAETCGCPVAGTGITAAACGSTCTGGGTAGKYVTITVSGNHQLLFTWPGLNNPVPLTSTARVRIP